MSWHLIWSSHTSIMLEMGFPTFPTWEHLILRRMLNWLGVPIIGFKLVVPPLMPCECALSRGRA
jgi:hypothetical protein